MHRAPVIFLAILLAGCGAAQREVEVFPADQTPVRLSDWGIVFAAGGRLELNDRVTAYELNAPLFSDYALKLRTIWMPQDAQASYAENDVFDFPVGTIISKTFHYEKTAAWTAENPSVVMSDKQYALAANEALDLDDHVLIETRMLVRYESGWRGYPYVWNADQSDAMLEIAGDIRRVQLVGGDASQEINYVVPDANQWRRMSYARSQRRRLATVRSERLATQPRIRVVG